MLNLILSFLCTIVNGGVIDNKSSPAPEPDNTTTTNIGLTQTGMIIIGIVIFCIITAIALYFMLKEKNNDKTQKKD